jgi:acyl-CoA reductase-like NAD-dependent aldehyde dehydrogenase
MSALPTRFDRLAANTPALALAQTTATQRCEKLQRLLDATLAAKDDIVDACARELNSSYVSTAFQLLLVKHEIGYLNIYASERERVDYYLRHTSAGSIAVNNKVVQAGISTLPFGGVGDSGMGRVNGRQSFRKFSNARAVVEDALYPQLQPQPSPQQLRQLVDQLLCS